MEQIKAHRYRMHARPLWIGTAPKGFLPCKAMLRDPKTAPAQNDEPRFGWVLYREPLTDEQVYNFELKADGQIAVDWDGYEAHLTPV